MFLRRSRKFYKGEFLVRRMEGIKIRNYEGEYYNLKQVAEEFLEEFEKVWNFG